MSDELSRVTVPLEDRGEPLDWLVDQALEYVHAEGDGHLREREAVAGLLRNAGPPAVEAIRRRYDAADPRDYPLRWLLLYLVSTLGQPTALEWLRQTAIQPLPPGTDEPGCETSQDSEVLVRVMATQAVIQLSTVIPDDTVQTLLAVVAEQGHVSVRAVAVSALLELDPGSRGVVEALLPDEQRFVLELHRVEHTDLAVDLEQEQPYEAGPAAPRLAADRHAPSTT